MHQKLSIEKITHKDNTNKEDEFQFLTLVHSVNRQKAKNIVNPI